GAAPPIPRLPVPAAILAGTLLLTWPAFLNGYPILFSDTGAFLHQTLGPLMIWDKPWIYGPLLHLFHQRQSLWPPLLAQGLMLSWLLWLTARALALRVATPLLAACALLLLTNAIGHGRWSLSPYGSTFLLARLVANGPAARTIAAECPGRGWYLCAWAGHLPTDSDVFLWEPDSPVNSDADGRPRFLGGVLLVSEAREIIAETLRREPLAVLRNALRDTARQLVTNGIGDTLPRGAVGEGLALRIASGFPPAELHRFESSAQMRGLLPQRAAPFLPLQAPALLLAALGLPILLWRHRHDPRRRALALCVLLGLAANAFATGALSKPHQRYGARIAWLLPAAALLLAQPRRDTIPPQRPGT
ncbi:hypothetical protein, partial [Roseomonas mucosa]|uniref:hypothetical protein n=1 Tax=Roseomonas mucosa TaxID=207340 RepID=UPI0030B952CD